MFTTTSHLARRALTGLAILLPLLLVVTALAAGVCGPTWATVASSPLLGSASAPAPVAPAAGALAASAVAPAAVCGSDTDCAAWALEHSQTAAPMVDDRGEPFCLPGASLYDTETPAVGDEGVVCTPDAQPSSQATEDSPDFQCQVDGNMQCGTGVAGGPVLEPATDGGTGYVCPAAGQLGVNAVGVVVCFYGQST